MADKPDLFIIWNPFQRRSETLSSVFRLRSCYFHFQWEERSKFMKVLSYVPKFILTFVTLVRYRPKFVFVQLAPTVLLYAASLYRLVFGGKIVADCHNTMLYDDHWIHWPLAKTLLRKSDLVLVHNDDVQAISDSMGIESIILRDPLPSMEIPESIDRVAGVEIKSQPYVIIPCGIAADEPVQELFDGIRAVPSMLFVMTWFKEKLPPQLISLAPNNMIFTGFLPEPEFNALFANAKAAMVLTTREGTQPSGAAEAISLGIPLIVSRVNTTQRLYGDAPVFVDNNADSISRGIRDALNHYESRSAAISALRDSLIDDAAIQISRVKEFMAQYA